MSLLLVCDECAEINPAWELENGYKRCQCGGRLLTVQEAADYILELKRIIDNLESGY